MVNHLVTTILDAIGILLLGFGFAAAVFPLLDWASVGVGGVVILLCSWFVSRERDKGEELE